MEIESLSDIFGGKVPGLNVPLKFKDAIDDTTMKSKSKSFGGFDYKLKQSEIEQKVFGGIKDFNIEKIGWGNSSQKSKIWGSSGRGINKDFFSMNREVKTPVGELQTYTKRPKEEAVAMPQVETIPQNKPTFIQGLTTGVTNVLKGTGIIKTPEERMEIQQQKTERLQLLKQMEDTRAQAMRTRAEAQPKTIYIQPSATDNMLYAMRGGVTQFGRDLSMGAAMAPISGASKISSLIGLTSSGMGAYQALGIAPPMGMPMASQPSSMGMSAPTGDNVTTIKGVQYVRMPTGRWRNMKTGKEVSYPRGRYSGHAMPMTIQQQYQQGYY
jgi:hypothetical protein